MAFGSRGILFLFLLFCVFMETAESIVHPYCPQDEVPIISLTQANFYDYQYSVSTEHFDAIASVWKVKATEDSRNIGGSFVNLPGNYAGIQTDTSITKFGHNLTVQTYSASLSYKSVMVELITISGEYDVTLSCTFGSNSHDQIRPVVEVINAPPKEIVLTEGESKKLHLSSVWDSSFTIVSRQVLKRNHSSNMKFESSYDVLYINDSREDMPHKSEEFGADGPEVVSVEMAIDNFDDQFGSGFYCMIIEGKRKNSFTVKIQACTQVTINGSTLGKSVTMETCSWQKDEPLMDKAAVKDHTQDCIICSAIGCNETILLTKRDNQWKVLSTSKLPVNQPSAMVRRSIMYIEDVNESINGNYMCLCGNGINGKDMLAKNLEVSNRADIELYTHFARYRRTIFSKDRSGYYQRLTHTGYNITCSKSNFEGPIFLSLWMQVQGAEIEPFTDQNNNCFIAETKSQERNTKIEAFFVPEFWSSGCRKRDKVDVVKIFCKAQTDWLTKFARVVQFGE